LKIVYFYQYFTTPKGSYGTRVYEFTREWVKQGHDVTVVSSVYYKSDVRATRYIDDQVIDGVKIKLLNIWIDNKQSLLKRMWKFVAYSFLSSYYALTLPADVVIASSGPLSVGLPGLIARYIRGRKLVFEVRDLWPQGAIELGLINNKFVQRFAFWLEKRCYLAASKIVTLSPGMSQNIHDRYGLTNLVSVTNSANIELFKPGIDAEIQKTLWRYAIYTGNVGEVNNSMWLVRAARILKERKSEVSILIIGDGQQRQEIELIRDREQLNNLLIYALMPKEKLVAYIQNAMASLVPLKGQPILDTSSPNKFFESMACGVPVIQNTQGWMKDFLEEHKVGFTLPPDDGKPLADLLIRLAGQPNEILAMGRQARQIAEDMFDKKKLAAKMLAAMVEINPR